MSVRGSIGLPSTCSGLMYKGVPIVTPLWVRCKGWASSPKARARPKSATLTAPRRGQGGRLRPGPRLRRGRPALAPHPERRDDGHAFVHESRAGRGQADRPAHRHLLLRGDVLPPDGRAAAVPRAERLRGRGAARAEAAGAAGGDPPRPAGGTVPADPPH